MQEEVKRLKRVVNTINLQISENLLKIAEQEKAINLSRDLLTMNFNDLDNEELSRHKVDIDEGEKIVKILEKNNKRLEKQTSRPYFARIDFKSNGQEEKIYIGLGLVKDGQSPIVYDWRAPISSMYYDFDIGNAHYSCEEGRIEGDITLKRQFSIEDQKLKYFIDTSQTINDEILQEVLSKNTSSKMKEIVSTIQREQNQLIRVDEMKNMLVQGVAGSGKTSVALHRAGYLLYKNKDITSDEILILSPSSLFSDYISQVLPELGEDNLLQGTFLNIAKAELGTKILSRESLVDELILNKKEDKLLSVAYKSSFSFLEDLIDFLKNTFTKTFRPRQLSFSTKESENPLFVFTKEEMEKLFFETYKDLPVSKRISYMSEYLIERFNLKKKEFLPIKDRFAKMLYNFFPTTDLNKILSLFLLTKGIDENKTNIFEYDDLAGLLIIKEFMFGIKTDDKVKYLIIDEMQDFTPAHFYIFNKIWPCPKLLLGDINQCIEKKLSKDYLHMLSDYLKADLITLNKTYRSTKQISQFCQKIIGLTDVINVNRDGEKPEIIKTADQTMTIKACVLENQDQFKHIAVVCKTSQEAKEIYEDLSKVLNVKLLDEKQTTLKDKVLITTATCCKGIEFDYVIIPNCDEYNYKDGLDQNLLYIAGTRALHKLTILYTNKKSSFLN